MPTAEEVDEHDALSRASEPIWTAVQPEAKPLHLSLMDEGRKSQEYHPLFINGLTLPPLRVAA